MLRRHARPWLALAVLALGGCAALVPEPAEPPPSAPVPVVTAERVAAALATEGTGPESESATGQGDTASGEGDTIEGRIRQAYRLSRRGATAAELERAASLLVGLEDEISDPAAREIVLLLQRHVALGRKLAAERRNAADLHRKIDQIKALERELQQRHPGSGG